MFVATTNYYLYDPVTETSTPVFPFDAQAEYLIHHVTLLGATVNVYLVPAKVDS